jgi:hypothetical protein
MICVNLPATQRLRLYATSCCTIDILEALDMHFQIIADKNHSRGNHITH